MVLGQGSVPMFSALDYTIFGLVLVISFVIGLYYGIWSKNKPTTPQEYFLGNRNMGILPVATSLLVTFVSGISLIAVSSDVYAHGTLHWLYAVSNLVMVIATSSIFLPVFYELRLPSSFSYLKLRFGRKVQLLASFIYLVGTTFLVAVILYIPSMVINHAVGTPAVLTTIVLGLVCIFYTAIGGFRAVILADLFQATLMIASCLSIVCVGFGLVGGFGDVWAAAERGGRLIYSNLNPDPTIRLTTWTFVIGYSYHITQHFGLNQQSVQRYLSVSNITRARVVLILFYLGQMFFISFAILAALLIYAYYETCDPLSSGVIQKLDQLMSYFVFEMSKHFPGLSGLFIAGLIASTLSTMSSCLNSSTVCLYEDFIKPILPQMSQKTSCNLLKLLTLLLGCLQIVLVFVVEKLGTIYVILITVTGLTNGAMLGLFTMGMLVPKSNQTGAIAGTISSIIGSAVLVIGGLSRKPDPPLPMRTDGCDFNVTISTNLLLSTASTESDPNSNLPWIFRISFMYYTSIGFMIVFLVGYPVSLLTGGSELTDKRLLAPFIRKYLTLRTTKTDAEEINPLSEARYNSNSKS